MDKPSTSKVNALAGILAFQFSFAALLHEGETMFELDDQDDGSGSLIDACFSLWSRLGDLKESAQEAAEHGEDYPITWAREQWLDTIATYAGILQRRLDAGEVLLESEGVTATFKAELAVFRVLLRAAYPAKRISLLEARTVVET